MLSHLGRHTLFIVGSLSFCSWASLEQIMPKMLQVGYLDIQKTYVLAAWSSGIVSACHRRGRSSNPARVYIHELCMYIHSVVTFNYIKYVFISCDFLGAWKLDVGKTFLFFGCFLPHMYIQIFILCHFIMEGFLRKAQSHDPKHWITLKNIEKFYSIFQSLLLSLGSLWRNQGRHPQVWSVCFIRKWTTQPNSSYIYIIVNFLKIYMYVGLNYHPLEYQILFVVANCRLEVKVI
jgi:hypothetical protein